MSNAASPETSPEKSIPVTCFTGFLVSHIYPFSYQPCTSQLIDWLSYYDIQGAVRSNLLTRLPFPDQANIDADF
jgi:hypothetical protein